MDSPIMINSPLLGGHPLQAHSTGLFTSQSMLSFSPASSHAAAGPRSRRTLLTLALAVCATGVLVWLLATPGTAERMSTDVVRPLVRLVKPDSAPASALQAACDPFTSAGQVETVQGDVDANLWRPWDPTCNASTLFTDLRNRQPLPFLHNKTIALFGDSIDRDHIEYFCEMARGNMEWVWQGTRYSPPVTLSPGDPTDYRAEDNGQSEGGEDQSRPRICTIGEYDFAIVFAFHYGLSDGSKAERALPHFYPPFRFQDRLSDILLPILHASGRWPPSMLELSTGTWDLQHFTIEDRQTDSDRLTPLSKSRAEWYKKRFVRALQAVEDAFSQDDSESEIALVFREMQHTKMVDSVPPPRVHGLRNLQTYILEQENRKSKQRWQIDPLARLLLGQEHNYRDAIHPIQLPAGKLWADIILHRLQALSVSVSV